MPVHAQRMSSLLASDREFAFCRVEKRAHATRGERAWGDGGASGMHREGPTQGWGGQGTRGAHGEHVVHGCDAGRVEAERLVEHRRGLPSRKAGMRCGKRCSPAGVRALGGGDAIGMRGEGPTQGWGARARAERTRNMRFMVVTLDVSKLSGWLNADACCRVERAGMRCGKRCDPGGV